MSSGDASRVAGHVALAYFAVALAVTWAKPVWGGCVAQIQNEEICCCFFLAELPMRASPTDRFQPTPLTLL